jgi:hypothetical protein
MEGIPAEEHGIRIAKSCCNTWWILNTKHKGAGRNSGSSRLSSAGTETFHRDTGLPYPNPPHDTHQGRKRKNEHRADL